MTFLRALLTVVFAGLFVVAASAQPTQGRRVALVIGNSAYTAQGALANPGPVSRLVADALRRVGFTVTAQNDLGKQAMERALRDFSRSADGAEVALVYYAGHGLEANGDNWLLPVDAQLADERDLSFEAISLDTVLGTVERARGLRMVVLDACRNNPFTRSMRRSPSTTRSVTRGLAEVETTGTLVVYAARANTTSLDGVGLPNSPFATAFAKRVVEPGIDIQIAMRRVRDDVLAATNRQQEPFSYGSLPGETLALSSLNMTSAQAFGIDGLSASQAAQIRRARDAAGSARQSAELARTAAQRGIDVKRRAEANEDSYTVGMSAASLVYMRTEVSEGEVSYGYINHQMEPVLCDQYAGELTSPRYRKVGVYQFCPNRPNELGATRYEGQNTYGEADALEGVGVLSFKNGDKYEGGMSAGAPNGFGVMILRDGTRIEGGFKNGRVDGFGIRWDANGQINQIGTWSLGRYVGAW